MVASEELKVVSWLEDEDDHGIISGESGDEFMEAARK
jgi:hypothetical protein